MLIRLKDYNGNIVEHDVGINPNWIIVLLVISGDEVLNLYSNKGDLIATLDSNEHRFVDYFDSMSILSFNELEALNK